MKEKLMLTLVGLIWIFSDIKGQNSVDIYAKSIKYEKLKEHVYILASDSCAGRNIGTAGIKIARDYIVSQWENVSTLKPYFKQTWLQPFPLISYGDRMIHLQANNFDFVNYKDFMYTGASDCLYAELPIVFAGYGRDEDYKNLDVTGKAVLTFNSNLRAAMKNAQTAGKYGAVLTIIANPEKTNQFESYSSQLKDFQKFKMYRSPNDTLFQSLNILFPDYRHITVSSETVKKLTSHSIYHWKKEGLEGNDSIGTVKISIEPVLVDTVIENNIVAFIPGSNMNESILIAAHYDHLGVVEKEIYYGADDNASGIAALLELSKIFAKAYNDGYKPQRNIIFIAFSAEEGGLLGSEYFVQHLHNKGEIKLMLNIDMIGRADIEHSDNSGYFYFISKNITDSLNLQNKQICAKYHLTPDYSSSSDASDHKSFSQEGIPAVFYFDGRNVDLHKTTDTTNKIDFKRMERISRMIFETIWINAGCKKE